MFKRIVFIACIGMLFFGTVGLSYTTTLATAQLIDVGNKICPVAGEKIDEKTKATYEYKGKVYNFCCSGCIDEFKKDPDKYIKNVDNELHP